MTLITYQRIDRVRATLADEIASTRRSIRAGERGIREADASGDWRLANAHRSRLDVQYDRLASLKRVSRAVRWS